MSLRLRTFGAFLMAGFTAGCSSSKDDGLVYDTAMNRDIQLARVDSVGQPILRDSGSVPMMIPRTTTPFPPRARPSNDPSSRMRLQDSATTELRHTALTAASTAAESVAIETLLKNLREASISFWAPDTLFISRPELVKVIIDPKLTAQAPRVGRPQIRPAKTRISSRTEVCLAAPGLRVDDGEGTDKQCRTQPVAFTAPSQWQWTVTALPEIKQSDTRRINVTVNAYLDTFPKWTVYSTHHQAYVHVDDPGRLERIKEFLSTWQAIAVSLAAIVTAIGLIWRNLRGKKPEGGG